MTSETRTNITMAEMLEAQAVGAATISKTHPEVCESKYFKQDSTTGAWWFIVEFADYEGHFDFLKMLIGKPYDGFRPIIAAMQFMAWQRKGCNLEGVAYKDGEVRVVTDPFDIADAWRDWANQ